MGSNCCKEIKVRTDNVSATFTNSTGSISWIKGIKIGNGVSATVYKAINTKTGSIFAVKSIPLSRKKDHSQSYYSIHNEVEILKSLSHPNIIKFYDSDLDIETNEIFIVCEYASHGDLLSLVKQFSPLSMKIVKKFIKELLQALEYIHSKGIIHRDLKCANILIDQNSTIKLSDFGLSSLVNSKSTQCVGSPYWMAPELFSGEKVTTAVDIWALGCTVIEMVTSLPPWSKVAKNEKELKILINSPDLLKHLPSSSESLRKFLGFCLATDPAMRPSASDLLKSSFLEECEDISAEISSTSE